MKAILKLLCLIIFVLLFVIKPWNPIYVESILTNANHTTYTSNIYINGNLLFIYDDIVFSNTLWDLYLSNSLPGIMLSHDISHSTNNVTFHVYTNTLTKLLGFNHKVFTFNN